MPIYEYRCQQCDADFELLVRSSRDKVKCPKCAGWRVRRKLSVFAMSPARSAGISPATMSQGLPRHSDGGVKRQNHGQPLGPSSCTSCRATSCVGCRK
ncbi:MAG: zinc ribbon domain-containing protein [Sedimentisphaerales bacterium]